jgi:hypothetical protein
MKRRFIESRELDLNNTGTGDVSVSVQDAKFAFGEA